MKEYTEKEILYWLDKCGEFNCCKQCPFADHSFGEDEGFITGTCMQELIAEAIAIITDTYCAEGSLNRTVELLKKKDIIKAIMNWDKE